MKKARREWLDLGDSQWFLEHPGRVFHIRSPIGDECVREFLSLGDHRANRRRIILHLLAPEVAQAHRVERILKIPFLAFADETIEDDDGVLAGVWHEIMQAGAVKYDVTVPLIS